MADNASIRIELVGGIGQQPGSGAPGPNPSPPSQPQQPPVSAMPGGPTPSPPAGGGGGSNSGRRRKPTAPKGVWDFDGKRIWLPDKDEEAEGFRAAELLEEPPDHIPMAKKVTIPMAEKVPKISEELSDIIAKGGGLRSSTRSLASKIGDPSSALGGLMGGRLAAAAGPIGVGIAAGLASIGASIKLMQSVIKVANATTDRISKYSPAAAGERARQQAATTLADVSLARTYSESLAEWERVKGFGTRASNEFGAVVTSAASKVLPSDPFDISPMGNVKGVWDTLENLFGIERPQAREGAMGEKGIIAWINDSIARMQGNTKSYDLFTWWSEVEAPDPPEHVLTDGSGMIDIRPQGRKKRRATSAPDPGPAPAAIDTSVFNDDIIAKNPELSLDTIR